MSYAQFRTPQQTFKKIEFIDLSVGQHLIRILTVVPVLQDTHYIKGMTIACLGDGCPICKNNVKLRIENAGEKNPSNISGYSAKRQVGYINVLDRTPVKICSNCGKEVKKVNGTFPPACPGCNTLITTVKAGALNKVKVLSKGKQFFDQVNFHDATVLDEETQTPIGVTNFDLTVLVTGPKVPPTVAPNPERNDVVVVEDKDLFDLERALVRLTEEEISDFLRGAKIKDIFLARAGNSFKPTELAEENVDMQNQIKDLWSN